MTSIDDHRWHLADENFASRVDLPDARTFFDQNLLIEEGTRALVLENGYYRGEVPAGQYTLATFSAHLPEWSQQQATVILSRATGQQLEISCQQIPTQDNIQVHVFFHAEVRVNNPTQMLQDMPDASAKMTVETLQETVQKMLEHAAWESVGAHLLGDLGTVISDHIQRNDRLHKRMDAKGIGLFQLKLFSFQQVGSEAVELVGEELMLEGLEAEPESAPQEEPLQLGDDQLVMGGHEVKDSLNNEVTEMSELAAPTSRPEVSLNNAVTGDSTLASGKHGNQDIFKDFQFISNLEDRYEIQETLGEGGFGQVKKAVERQLERTVALKFLHSEYRNNQRALRRFLTEAKSIAALNHNNIVHLIDMERSDEGPFIVMEFVEGGSLADLIQEGALEPAKAANIICQVCGALSMAHARGIIHRDIKPANILMTSDGVPKLSDFGLANESQAEQSITEKGATLGTMSYMAPEQRQDASQADERSDIFSLAATLYECVTGEVPRIINFEMVPTVLRGTLVTALKNSPGDRFEDVSAFSRALQEAIAGGAEIGKQLDVGQCNQCYQTNGAKAQFCKACGNSLKNDCPNKACNKVVGCWELFCQKCGENINELIEEKIKAFELIRLQADELEKQQKFEEADSLLAEIPETKDQRITKKTSWIQHYRHRYEIARLESLKSYMESLRQQERYEDVLEELESLPTITNPELKNYIPWFGDFKNTCHDEHLQNQRSQIDQLRSENRYIEAIELLESIPPIQDIRLREHNEWVREYKILFNDELQRLNQQQDQLLAEARSIAAQGNYQGAIEILENLPGSEVSGETIEMMETWRQKLDEENQHTEEIEYLQQGIQQLESNKDYAGMLQKYERLLELQPDNEDARDKVDQLQAKIDFQERAREWRRNQNKN